MMLGKTALFIISFNNLSLKGVRKEEVRKQTALQIHGKLRGNLHCVR